LDGGLDGTKSIFHFNAGRSFSIGEMELHPFSVPHDAVDPVGFVIRYRAYQVGIAVDLGYATHLVRERLKESQLIILESNYDTQLLKTGPYPWTLKQRLQGRHGHLSNKAAAELLSALIHPKLEHVVLAHLSRTNNQPHLVYQQAQAVLGEAPDNRVQLSIAHQHRVGQVIELR
jgi:phosphoribosyl 1,2-cyclic phosphodiesterase